MNMRAFLANRIFAFSRMLDHLGLTHWHAFLIQRPDRQTSAGIIGHQHQLSLPVCHHMAGIFAPGGLLRNQREHSFFRPAVSIERAALLPLKRRQLVDGIEKLLISGKLHKGGVGSLCRSSLLLKGSFFHIKKISMDAFAFSLEYLACSEDQGAAVGSNVKSCDLIHS